MTVGSLFSGIGGIDLGLERAGMELRWQVEIEEYPRRVLEKHWPDVTRYQDVREVGAENLESVDLIAGGFPCQDISYAGMGAGLEGERSGLWYEFARVVREMGPRYVLVENVPALLTRGLDAVLGTLAESGYDAEWDCIPAAAVGAPHRRDRVFVVAYPQEHSERVVRGGDGGDDVPNSEGDGRGQGRAGRPTGVNQGVRDPEGYRKGLREAGRGLRPGDAYLLRSLISFAPRDVFKGEQLQRLRAIAFEVEELTQELTHTASEVEQGGSGDVG